MVMVIYGGQIMDTYITTYLHNLFISLLTYRSVIIPTNLPTSCYPIYLSIIQPISLYASLCLPTKLHIYLFPNLPSYLSAYLTTYLLACRYCLLGSWVVKEGNESTREHSIPVYLIIYLPSFLPTFLLVSYLSLLVTWLHGWLRKVITCH